jgi:hypothetical protein
MFKKVAIGLLSSSLALFISEALVMTAAFSQSAQQNANTDSTVNGDFNNVIQVPNQNNAENHNINEIKFPNIYPLDNPIYTPINTENDLGFNLSVGANTLDTSNVTLYLGVIYQPGRSRSHQARMSRLKKETELLEVQRQIAEAKLQLLQQQITQAKSQLQGLH